MLSILIAQLINVQVAQTEAECLGYILNLKSNLIKNMANKTFFFYLSKNLNFQFHRSVKRRVPFISNTSICCLINLIIYVQKVWDKWFLSVLAMINLSGLFIVCSSSMVVYF